MPTKPLPRWRSVLFVPATADKLIARAQERGADAVQLDLEDAVPADRKDAARAMLPGAIRHLVGGEGDVLVRINREWRQAVRDLEAAVQPGVRAITLPKLGGPHDLAVLDEMLTELEAERGLPPGGIGVVGQIETARGLLAMQQGGVAPGGRLLALTLGPEDYTADLGVEPTRDTLRSALRSCVLIARAAGALPMGFAHSIADFEDLDALGAAVRDAYAMGLRGSFCVHPRQVAVLNAGFQPTPEAAAHAREVVASFDAARQAGSGVAKLHGKMIDRPVYNRALAVLAEMEPQAAPATPPGVE